ATIVSNGKPKSVRVVNATASLFKTLGVQPLIGRWIDPASNRPSGPREAMLSYRFWQSAFGGNTDAIGKPLQMDGEQYTVVGIMPRHFEFPNRAALLWRSLVLSPKDLSPDNLTSFYLNMVVRRAPGVSQAELHTALNAQV